MGRSPCCSKIGLNRGAWTATEDQILIAYIKAHGEGNWRSLPKRAGLKRCGKSCRLRWMNYLKPDIKRGNISLEEEDLIIRLHKLLGNRWSLIAGRLPGRTDNEIKNYWNTTLSKRIGPNSSAKPISKRSTRNKSYKARKQASSESKATEDSVVVSAQSAAIRTKAHRFTKSLIPNVMPSLQNGDNSVIKSATQTALNQIQQQLNQEMDCEIDQFQEAFDQDMELLKFPFSDYYQLPIDNQAMLDWTPSDLLNKDNNQIDFGDLMACFLDDQEDLIRDESSSMKI